MPFDPFRGGGDGSSLEHDDPISNSAKNVTKAVSTQTQQQVQATKQTFVDMLYGNVSSQETGDPSHDPLQAAQQSSTPAPSPASSSGLAQAVNPGEQSKLDETRRKLAELEGLHKKTYFETTFGDEAQQKRREREEEERQIKMQEEEEQQQAEADHKAAMDESLQSFTQKGKGPAQLSDPVALQQAKTKTEINRGSSG